MKYSALFFFTTLCITGFAQQKSFVAGIEGGPSAIILYGHPELNTVCVPTMGFSGGLFFQYNFINRTSLRTNISFEEKGTATSNTLILTSPTGATTGSVTIKGYTHYNYVTVPLLFRKSFGSKTTYFINGGPYFGYLFGLSSGTNNTLYSAYNPPENIESYKKFDGGISAGLGFTIPLKVVSVSFELRNNLGLVDIYLSSINSDRAIRTNSTNLLIGLSYPLWKKQLTEKDFDYR